VKNLYKTIEEYLVDYDIDLDATEGLDYLIEVIHNDLLEALTKQDVKDEVINVMSTSELQKKIEKMVADKIKNDKALEDKVVEISRNVLTQLFKALWTKRSFWKAGLTNKAS
jgi:hypothetical protein